MSNIKFGWHMHSFPTDGSSANAFLQQLTAGLNTVHDHFDSVWVDDHFWPWATFQADDTPYTECVTTLAYYAALYPKLRFASSVFCQAYRTPGVLAKTAANLQWLTGGRFIFGIGAGWMEEEYQGYAYDFPKPSVRIAQLEEALQVVRTLWSESPASFEGKYYRIKDAYCEPRPVPPPPILIGGGGEELTLRVVAKHADWWNFPGGTLENYAHKLNVLRRHCDAVGRDYNTITKTWNAECVAVARTEAEAQRIAEASPYKSGPIVGTPPQVAEQLQQFIDLGVEHIAIRTVDFPSTAGLELFITEVMPQLQK